MATRASPGLTISKEGVSEVEAAHHTRERVVGGAGLDAALHGGHFHVVGAGLPGQLRVGFLQLEGRGAPGHRLLPHGLPPNIPPPTTRGLRARPGRGRQRPAAGHLTLLLALAARFAPDTRLLRMRLKDWRRDFLSDFARERGPSMARESLGWRVHLGADRCQLCTERPPGAAMCCCWPTGTGVRVPGRDAQAPPVAPPARSQWAQSSSRTAQKDAAASGNGASFAAPSLTGG